MVDIASWTDEAILGEIGARLQTERLNRNLTAQEIADRAGVSLATIYKVEQGGNHSVRTLVRILRALDLVSRIEALLPDQGPSPIQLAMLRGKQRQRATGRRGRSAPASESLPW